MIHARKNQENVFIAALIWSANSHLFNLLPHELGLHLAQEQRVCEGKGNKSGWD
jgi:hypothetical protein